MYCSKCGNQIQNDSKFCQHCGTKAHEANNLNSEKKCPFCKKTIALGDDSCPSCGKILIERLSNNSFSEIKSEETKKQKDYVFEKPGKVRNKINFSKFFNKYLFWIIIVAIIIWLIAESDTSYDSPTTPLPQPKPTPSAGAITIPARTNSLSTGTQLKKNPRFLQGDGELEIQNGTSLDAVAKLVINGESVFTVYIKAKTNYTILNISDGVYWLIFARGSDWNSKENIFNRDVQYSAFEETFKFETTDYEYRTWEVTLNPVVGGSAETIDVDPSKFNAY